MEKEIVKQYTNGDVVIVWKPNVCTHSAICFRGLPSVFDPRIKPWINPQGATSEEMMTQIKKCPSGALSYIRKETTGSE